MGFCQSLCLLGQIGRGTDIRWKVAQVFGETYPRSDGQPTTEGIFTFFQIITLWYVDNQLGNAFGFFFLIRLAGFAFHLVKTVGTVHGNFGQLSHFPGNILFFDWQLRQKARYISRTAMSQGLYRGSNGCTVFAFVQFTFLTQAHQQNSIAQGTWYAVQQQAAAELTFHIAATQDAGNIAASRMINCCCSG